MAGNLRTPRLCVFIAAWLALGAAAPAVAGELQDRLFGGPGPASKADDRRAVQGTPADRDDAVFVKDRRQHDGSVTPAKFSSPASRAGVSRLQAVLRAAQKNNDVKPPNTPPRPALGEAPMPPGGESLRHDGENVQRLVDPPALLTTPKLAQRLQFNAPSTEPIPPAPDAEVVKTPVSKSSPRGDKEALLVSRLSRPLHQVGIDTAPTADLAAQSAKTPDALKIKNLAAGVFGDWNAPAPAITEQTTRYPVGMSLSWAAPASYHRPLYFEQPNVERYGHTVRLSKHGRGLLTQSAVSAAHFFGTVPVLPYLVGAEGAPCERSYVLGAYRPGSCNPHQLVVPPINLRGALFEGASVTGLAFFIP